MSNPNAALYLRLRRGTGCDRRRLSHLRISMRSLALPVVLACLVAAPAAADVTVTSTTSGKIPMGGDLAGTQVTRIKGNKMRMDMTQGDRQTAIILDVDGQRMISL